MDPDNDKSGEVAERLLASALGFLDIVSLYLGDRLGWYAALAADGPATARELAQRTGTSGRYAREWLEQQAVTGFLRTDPAAPAEQRRYELPPATREVLTDPLSLDYLAPLARMLVGPWGNTDALVSAYREGGGVPWDALGDHGRGAQADMNRPWFERALGDAIAGVPDLHASLSGPEARVAEVGFGGGWASISLARYYPSLRVDGYEVDGPSVQAAQINAERAGVAERVAFHLVDGADLPTDQRYDAAFAFECIHDMPQPVPVLAAMRGAVRPGAPVVVMDEAVADDFTAPGDDLERLMYGFSLTVCLPDGMSSSPSVATGTVMRRRTLEQYAATAGFSGVEVLPVEGFGFWRFYRLRH